MASVERKAVSAHVAGFESSQWGPDYLIVVVADDGTVWSRSTCYNKPEEPWTALPPIPVRTVDTDDIPF